MKNIIYTEEQVNRMVQIINILDIKGIDNNKAVVALVQLIESGKLEELKEEVGEQIVTD